MYDWVAHNFRTFFDRQTVNNRRKSTNEKMYNAYGREPVTDYRSNDP